MKQLSLFPNSDIESESGSISDDIEPKTPIHKYFQKNTKPEFKISEAK